MKFSSSKIQKAINQRSRFLDLRKYTKNPSFCLLKNSKNRRNSSRGGYSQFLRVLKPVCFDHEFAFFTPHLLRGEETIRALKRGRRGSNGCSATGSRSTNNLVNEGWLLGPIGSRFLGRSGWCAGLRLALGCVSRAHPASTRACALSPPPRARLVANAFLSRAKSAPLTRAPSPFLSFRDNFLLLSGLNVSLLDNHVTSLPFLFNSIFHRVQSILVSQVWKKYARFKITSFQSRMVPLFPPFLLSQFYLLIAVSFN